MIIIIITEKPIFDSLHSSLQYLRKHATVSHVTRRRHQYAMISDIPVSFYERILWLNDAKIRILNNTRRFLIKNLSKKIIPKANFKFIFK